MDNEIGDEGVCHAEDNVKEIMFAEVDDGETDRADIDREQRNKFRKFFSEKERGKKRVRGMERRHGRD